ncbi:hypothetical protein, partial [Klebsiella quasipneumoniae]|uniref:hypothetical protein n=1 Tax=Klebsiella quasipneumoniae TaxID=1463165 RepID=UPI001D0D2A74
MFKNQARIKAQHLIWLKSERLNSFFEFILVTSELPPIMRLHWHGTTASKPPGQQDSTAKATLKTDREKQNKRLTLNEESVIYA